VCASYQRPMRLDSQMQVLAQRRVLHDDAHHVPKHERLAVTHDVSVNNPPHEDRKWVAQRHTQANGRLRMVEFCETLNLSVQMLAFLSVAACMGREGLDSHFTEGARTAADNLMRNRRQVDLLDANKGSVSDIFR
jgi:hypothetical protein